MREQMRQVVVELRKLPKRARHEPQRKQRARPTPERLRRAGGDFEHGDNGQITMRDSPLERALARNVISAEQYAAGQKYRHHWYHAGIADPLGSINANRIFATDFAAFSGMPKTEAQMFHRQRYREAVQAVGKIGSHVLDWAVCRETPLEQVGYTLGWTSRPQAYAAAAERAKTALDELCRLWGIAGEGRQ
jgi:uncharacterized protein DUF6456